MIKSRIQSLQKYLRDNKLSAILFTGNDPHLGEYPPLKWQTREWITGFSGSFGKVLVTTSEVLLWTDTRYFLQAEKELAGSGIVLMRERVPEAVSLEDWIVDHLPQNSILIVDAETISVSYAQYLETILSAKGLIFECVQGLVDALWSERPEHPQEKIFEHPLEFAGQSRKEKLEQVRSHLMKSGKDGILISGLEDIAWLFNLRGNDVAYTPLFTAFSYISQSEALLFIDSSKLKDELNVVLTKEGIDIQGYIHFYAYLATLDKLQLVIDKDQTNSLIHKLIADRNTLCFEPSHVSALKAIKSNVEILNIRQAHVKDGIAMAYFIYWLKHEAQVESISEYSLVDRLTHYRSKQVHFMGNSFHPIVGFQSNGAIVHYHPTPDQSRTLSHEGILLIDSGGQYMDGTTDLTRTFCLGIPMNDAIIDYTICLKGHINLANAVFPIGTRGHSLDALARKPLWDHGINYGHGTGHGIGYFSSVHEGPMSIRAESNNEAIKIGHLLSNEPGIYREGKYGIRIENVMVCMPCDDFLERNFLRFETISLCTFERELIELKMLDDLEIKWVDDYHKRIFDTLSPLINDCKVKVWLENQCRPLSETGN